MAYDPTFNSLIYGTHEGHFFETNCVGWLASKITNVKSHIGTKLDTEQGTDCTIGKGAGEIRIDFTMNFSNKSWMPFITETDIPGLPWQNLKMGIRHGNSHKGYSEFEKPVIVIGFDCNAGDMRQYEDIIQENFEQHAEDIYYAAMDCYLDYTSKGEEREELFSEPLKKNPSYKPPRELGKKYQQLNKMRMQIDKENAQKNIEVQDKEV